MTDNLFDPNEYTLRGRAPRTARVKMKPPDPERVVLGERGWALVSVKGHPGAHRVLDDQEATRVRRTLNIPMAGSAAITRCGRAGTPLTFEPGTVAGACADCWAKGTA